MGMGWGAVGVLPEWDVRPNVISGPGALHLVAMRKKSNDLAGL